MQGFGNKLLILLLATLISGLVTAFVRLETVHLNTKRTQLASKIEKAEFIKRELYLKLSEKEDFELLVQKSASLNLENSY